MTSFDVLPNVCFFKLRHISCFVCFVFVLFQTCLHDPVCCYMLMCCLFLACTCCTWCPGPPRMPIQPSSDQDNSQTDTRCCESHRCTSSTCADSHSHHTCTETQKQAQLSLCFTESSDSLGKEQQLGGSSSPPEFQLEHMATDVVTQVLRNAVTKMMDQHQATTPRHLTGGSSTDRTCNLHCCSAGVGRENVGACKGDDGDSGSEWEEEMDDKDMNDLDLSYYGATYHNLAGLNAFKTFLRETPGEQLLNLWLDIERLKATHNRERKKRWTSRQENQCDWD